MHKHLTNLIIPLSATLILSACGGGSTDDLEYTEYADNQSTYQPDPAKSIGNDGSIFIAPANQPNMSIPTPVLSLPPNRRI